MSPADSLLERTIPTRVGRTFPFLSRLFKNRTIPTRVGSTRASISAIRAAADHPHAGGEHGLPGASRAGRPRTIPTRVGRTRRKTAD